MLYPWAQGVAVLRELLQEVLDLQPEWSHIKTPEMDRRGIIVRREIPELLREHLTQLTASVAAQGLDWAVEGRDGTGPKTEVPWVRVYDRELSPSATQGWYVVYLFSALGDRLYLSIGHGSTKWTGVEFDPRPEDELREMATWARKVIAPEGLPAQGFHPEIELDARRSRLGAAYAAGTVLAKAYRSGELPSDDTLRQDLALAVTALGTLYQRAMEDPLAPGMDPPEVEALTEVIAEVTGRPTEAPRRPRISTGQGFGLSKAEQDAVEARAMRVALDHYATLGWTVRDVGNTESYDIDAKRGDEHLIVEVKGTTSLGRTVVLTANEVEIHRRQHPNTALFVVHSITLDRCGEKPIASGGTVVEHLPWRPEDEDLAPMAYRYKVPPPATPPDQ